MLNFTPKSRLNFFWRSNFQTWPTGTNFCNDKIVLVDAWVWALVKISVNGTASNESFCLDKKSSEKAWISFLYPLQGEARLWKWSLFKEKTPRQRANFSVENKLCFSCSQGIHAFRQWPKANKCTKLGCTSTNSVLSHGAEHVYPSRNPDNNDSHTRPKAGKTRTNAEQDKANTNADRKSFSKNIPKASSNHADSNSAPLEVSCSISNDPSSIITSKVLLLIIKLQVSIDFQSADCLTLFLQGLSLQVESLPEDQPSLHFSMTQHLIIPGCRFN